MRFLRPLGLFRGFTRYSDGTLNGVLAAWFGGLAQKALAVRHGGVRGIRGDVFGIFEETSPGGCLEPRRIRSFGFRFLARLYRNSLISVSLVDHRLILRISLGR